MDSVIRYLFWVILGAVMVVAGGLYLWVVPPLQDEVAKLDRSCQEKERRVTELANAADKLPTVRHVEAAKQYVAYLKTEESEVKALLKDKRTTYDPQFQAAPERPLEFDRWLSGVQDQILEEAGKAGLTLPTTFAEVWLDKGKNTSDAKDRLQRLEKVSLAAEVVRILAQTRVNVPEYGFLKDPKATEEPRKEVSAGALSLEGMERLDNKARLEREKKALEMAYTSWSATAPPATAAAKAPPEPYTATTLDIRFTAPFAAVPAIVRALEGSPRWFGIVRKIDCIRQVEPYKTPEQNPAAATPTPLTEPQTGRMNTHYREGPVLVQVWLDLLDFDAEKLK